MIYKVILKCFEMQKKKKNRYIHNPNIHSVVNGNYRYGQSSRTVQGPSISSQEWADFYNHFCLVMAVSDFIQIELTFTDDYPRPPRPSTSQELITLAVL